MELIINKALSQKLKKNNIVGIGSNTDDIGGICAATKNGKLIPVGEEVYDLVLLDLWDKKSKLIESFDRQFKITIEQVR